QAPSPGAMLGLTKDPVVIRGGTLHEVSEGTHGDCQCVRAGWQLSRCGRAVRNDPQTVRRVLERRDVGQPRRHVSMTSTAGVETVIAERVRASDGRICAKRLLPIVQAAGYTGSARNVRLAVASAKAGWKRKTTYVPTMTTDAR